MKRSRFPTIATQPPCFASQRNYYASRNYHNDYHIQTHNQIIFPSQNTWIWFSIHCNRLSIFWNVMSNYYNSMTESPKMWPSSGKADNKHSGICNNFSVFLLFRPYSDRRKPHKCRCIREGVFHLGKTVFQWLTIGFLTRFRAFAIVFPFSATM